MNTVTSLETYRRRRFPPRDFQIDPVMTVYVALDGVLKAMERLPAAAATADPDDAHLRIAAERARLLQGIDFVFGGIDLGSGTLASALLFVLMQDLRRRLVEGLDRGQTRFSTEAAILRTLHAIFDPQAVGSCAHAR